MTNPATSPTTPEPSGDRTTAPDGASCRVRRSYGPSYALAPAQGSGGGPAGSRARARGDQPDVRSQGAPDAGEQRPDDAQALDQQRVRTPAFPDRKPRRRARNPSERAHKLTTRLSDTEYAEIADAAKRHAYTVARFLADAALAAARGRTSVRPDQQLAAAVDELAALRTSVSRVGNNINQIAHVYNAGGQPLPGRLDHALRVLLAVLDRIDDAADALVRRRP